MTSDDRKGELFVTKTSSRKGSAPLYFQGRSGIARRGMNAANYVSGLVAKRETQREIIPTPTEYS